MNKGSQILTFMERWLGRSGSLILVNETNKLGIDNLEDMSYEQKGKLLDAITVDALSTFLSHSRYMVARSQLVEILGLPPESSYIQNQKFREGQSPSLVGKPRESENME